MGFGDFMIEYKAIFGTLLGTIVTLVTTHFLKSKGKLMFEPQNWSLRFYKFVTGVEKEITSSEEASYALFNFELIIYNNSETPKSLKDIYLEIKDEKTQLNLILKNSNTARYSSGFRNIDEVKILNIAPKTMFCIPLEGNLDENTTKQIRNGMKVIFHAKDYKNKTYQTEIANISY
ncbi:hypothetical protein [Desulfitobacterium metallireducens]|uniref:DUF4352 domain-containing protein n=1 Tax=Desulfitobacterium metallireducens DSM 15288 TaxID=871968 RepID=W0EH86_9FIRM|nr:hypothetical protein [Desulfitobacterium metallireducens]AHF08574.1 hypothetical protein DESME_08960 [Desulfitobacterium metallireducens DSM 15288]